MVSAITPISALAFMRSLGRLSPALALSLLLATGLARADDRQPTPAYDYDFSQFIHWLEVNVDEKQLPGGALAIVSREGIIYLQTWGVRSVRAEAVVTTDSIFRIASISKTFAGTAAALLVEQNLQSWDTRVSDLFPSLQLGSSASSAQITLRHIVSHSTGLMPHSYSNMLDDGVPYDRIKQKFNQIPTVCAPGKCYGYLNVIFSLIADVYVQSP